MARTRGEQAAERARVAMARAEQLAKRLTELRDKRSANAAAVEQATRSATEALDHATSALQQAALAHHRAADLHRRVADLLDQIGQPDRATEHRRLAELDDNGGLADEALLRQARSGDA